MATKLENLELEIKHFRNFEKYLANAHRYCRETLELLLEDGIIQVSTAFEHALANVGGHTVVSYDVSDGSEAKISSVRTSGYGKLYGAPIKGVSGKTGLLRIQVYERKQDQFYYFCIPRYAYEHIPRTSNIEIPFELNGTPRKIPLRSVKRNWWNYEVATFEEMAKFANS